VNIRPGNTQTLQQLASDAQATYLGADPFPHIVWDNFFDTDYLSGLADTFPNLFEHPELEHFSNAKEIKSASQLEQGIPPQHLEFIHFLNSQPFIQFIQTLTGIREPLIGDPYLLGGGLHQIKKGGLLKVHADFNKHRTLGLDRRINVLVYLNKDWDSAYGGHLELWDPKMTRCAEKVLPVFNRMVVFSTTDFSYHGHPEPLTCPDDRTRNSIAMYYYSNGRPKSEVDVQNVSATTKFVSRPDSEHDRQAMRGFTKSNLIEWVKMCTPPIVWKALRSLNSK